MKKKVLVLLIALLLLLPAAVFAGDLLGLQLGASALYLQPVDLGGDWSVDPDSITVDSFYFGGELRISASVFELSTLLLPIQYGQYENGYYLIGYAFPGVGVSLELLGLVDVAATVGPAFEFAATTTGLFEGNVEASPLMGRLTADVDLGPVSLGAYVLAISNITVGEILNPGFDPGSISLPSSGYLGLSATVNLL